MLDSINELFQNGFFFTFLRRAEQRGNLNRLIKEKNPDRKIRLNLNHRRKNSSDESNKSNRKNKCEKEKFFRLVTKYGTETISQFIQD